MEEKLNAATASPPLACRNTRSLLRLGVVVALGLLERRVCECAFQARCPALGA